MFMVEKRPHCFLHVQTETLRVEGTELRCDSEEFLSVDLK